MTYRPEIDGLRSVAVIAVILFHLDKTCLTGGFLGVDVFFTISGYLISSIILRESARNEFRFWRFWKRRVKRLLPALMFMVAFVLIAGNFLMLRPERTGLPLQALASLLSYANLFFWKTTGGYWAAPAHSLPLLHTWTLSLEEQFYLVLPVLVILLRRFKFNLQLTTVCALLTVSFVFCVIATPSYRSATFFLLPTRMWELLLGVGLAYWHQLTPPRKDFAGGSHFVPEIGLGLILFSFWGISNDETFPGWKPLIPCLGTMLLLNIRVCQPSLALSLLKFPGFVFVGKLSYSLYLWHWPVFVFLPYTGTTSSIAKLSWTVFLAALSYFLVEQPLRYGSRWTIIGWATIPLAVIFGFGTVVTTPTSPLLSDLGNLDHQRSFRRGHEYEAIAKILENGEGVYFGDNMNRPLVCLVGSSHARVLGAPIHSYSEENGLGFLSLATSNLGLTSLANREVPNAETINAKRIGLIRQLRPELVIVAGMWSGESKREGFSDTLKSLLREFGNIGNQVVVIGQVPMVRVPSDYDGDLRKYLIAGRFSGRPNLAFPDSYVAKANSIVREVVCGLNLSNVIFLDPTPLLSIEKYVKLNEGDLFLYSDYHHINDDGANIVFEGILRKVLATVK